MGETGNYIKAVIFDMGGVLLRTVDPGPRTRLAEKFGLSMRQLEAVVFQSPHAIAAEEGKIAEEAHWLAVADDLKMDRKELPGFVEQYWAGDRLDYDLVTFIKSLRPERKTGLLSNAWSGARITVSKRFSFFDAFDQVVFSAETGMRKPDRAIFKLMLDRLGVSAREAVFVDDFPVNIQAAEAAGLTGIHFEDAGQAVKALQNIL